MPLTLLLVVLCVLSAAPLRADAPAPHPRGKTATPSASDPASVRSTGRMPAIVRVTPLGGTAPTHLVITIPRERLKGVVLPATTGAPVPGNDAADGVASSGIRHALGATFLALAIMSVPLLWISRQRRGAAVLTALLGLAAGTVLVRADIAAPRARPDPPAPRSTPVSPPQTVEVVIVPGAGPVQVQVTYTQP